MPTQQESPAPAPVAVSGTSSKMLRLVRKRLRQLVRVAIVLALGLAVVASALAVWWLTSLNELPDIGDPFDVEAFRAFSVPDDRNAFTYLRRASEKVTPCRRMAGGADPGDMKFSWSIADPLLREWSGENREAFELFRRGAEQLDAANPAGDPTADVHPGLLITLALLEASRRQEGGDTAGAWDCYRSVLRMNTHFRRRGNMRQRDCARGSNRMLQRRLTDWAADPRTTIPQLHAALEVVLENAPDPDWDRFAIKSGYLELMRALERPVPASVRQEIEGEWTFRLGDMSLSPGMVDHLEAARRFLLREPERSRRVLRLLCANYLAHAEARERPPRKPDVYEFGVPLYPVKPEAPAGARALSPLELAGWLVASPEARLRLMRGYVEWHWPADLVVDRRNVPDRRAHRELVIMLATEIYRRERGSLPPSDEALVGTYLKGLPDDGSGEVDDGTTPTVE